MFESLCVDKWELSVRILSCLTGQCGVWLGGSEERCDLGPKVHPADTQVLLQLEPRPMKKSFATPTKEYW